MFNGILERAILETLAYSDIFEYPLRLDELHRYLPLRVEVECLPQAIGLLHDQVREKDGYYFLAERENIMETRRLRERASRSLFHHAIKYGRILGALPFSRMVALTGSLAVMNGSDNADFDYMLVAASGRVWTARVFALLVNRMTRLFGHTLCPNLIISENALLWSRHDLYSARELCQMVPIAGLRVYRKLMKANEWLKDFLPNAVVRTSEASKASEFWLRRLPELPLRGKLGDRIEHWEMKRKIARFSKQEGFSMETVFDAEMCQGNFDHHRRRTEEAFQQRINNLVTVPSHPLMDEIKVGV
jgi:hypothetical protein